MSLLTTYLVTLSLENKLLFGKSLEKALNSVRALIVYQATNSQLLHYLFH